MLLLRARGARQDSVLCDEVARLGTLMSLEKVTKLFSHEKNRGVQPQNHAGSGFWLTFSAAQGNLRGNSSRRERSMPHLQRAICTLAPHQDFGSWFFQLVTPQP